MGIHKTKADEASKKNKTPKGHIKVICSPNFELSQLIPWQRE